MHLSLIEILKLKFDQDLCKNLWYELAFGNVLFLGPVKHFQKGDEFCQLSVIIMIIF